VPTRALLGGLAVVNVGGIVTVSVSVGLTASGLTPLVALTVNVNVPAETGVPDSTPVRASSSNPSGKAPEASAKLGAGTPDAANV